MSKTGGLNTDALVQDFNTTLVAGKSIKGAMDAVGAGKGNLWQVNIKDLRVLPGFNVRVRNAALEEHIKSLAESMAGEDGYIQHHVMAGFVALEGDQQIIYLTDGHCRMEAIHLANLNGAQITTVPVVVSTKGTSMEDLTIGLVRSNSGKRLEAFEMAVVAKRLAKWNWDHKKIAHRMGVSVTTVQNYLSLMEAPKEVRDMVAEGVVGMHTALDTLRARGSEAIKDLTSAATKSTKTGTGNGKKVERRDVIVPSFGTCVKKAAPRLFATINALRKDTGYQSLTDETRTKIDGLVEELEAMRRKASEALMASTSDEGEGEGSAVAAEVPEAKGKKAKKGGAAGNDESKSSDASRKESAEEHVAA